MRARLVFVLCMIALASVVENRDGSLWSAEALAQSSADDRTEAQAAFESGDFTNAARLWGQVASVETWAVDARINAAQAYLQADDLGRAMLYFKRAQTLDPRHSSVQVGLALVRALRVDVLDDENGLLPAVERLTVEVLSLNELGWVTAAAWSGVFVLLIGTMRSRRFKLPAAVFGVIAALLLSLLAGRDLSQRYMPSVVVTAFEAELASEPGGEGVDVSRVYAAAEARIGDRDGNWVLITLADGRAGWLPGSDIALVYED